MKTVYRKQSMKISTRWQQKRSFIATTEQGYTINMDGEGGAPSPMQLILAAIGGCSSIDVVMILEKGRHQITDCQCELDAERAETAPAVFTKIHAHYLVTGNDIPLSAIERACQLSIEKYCSAALMLNKTVDISFSFEFIQSTD